MGLRALPKPPHGARVLLGAVLQEEPAPVSPLPCCWNNTSVQDTAWEAKVIVWKTLAIVLSSSQISTGCYCTYLGTWDFHSVSLFSQSQLRTSLALALSCVAEAAAPLLAAVWAAVLQHFAIKHLTEFHFICPSYFADRLFKPSSSPEQLKLLWKPTGKGLCIPLSFELTGAYELNCVLEIHWDFISVQSARIMPVQNCH